MSLRIWIITVGEPLPTDGAQERLLRSGILANLLVARGHDITWWTSTLDHAHKKQRFARTTTLNAQPHLRLHLLHGVAYGKSVSLMRILNHHGVAKEFVRLSEGESRPDVILCSLPTLELCRKATEYGQRHGVPVVLDVRDLWPDLFLDVAPAWGKGVARRLLEPMYRAAQQSCAQATAIVGLTPAFTQWALTHGNRERSYWDREFAMGYMQSPPAPHAAARARSFWEEQGITRAKQEFLVCYFGVLGRQSELQPVIEAARRLQSEDRNIRFVFCGRGDRADFYREMAADCKNVLFPGWVGAAEIWTLMRMGAVGLVPYRDCENYTANLPNKPIEYLSAGLPVVSSLQHGVLKELLAEHDCGFTYGDSGDLATRLCALYDDRARHGTLAQNALTLYNAQFVGERVYAGMADYLEEMARNGPPADGKAVNAAGSAPAISSSRNGLPADGKAVVSTGAQASARLISTPLFTEVGKQTGSEEMNSR